MKFFFVAFLVITGISAYFWITDEPGSGMWIPTVVFAGLAVGTGLRNWVKNGSPLAEGPSLNDKAGR